MKFTILLFLALTACGTNNIVVGKSVNYTQSLEVNRTTVDPILLPYVQNFLADCSFFKVDCNIDNVESILFGRTDVNKEVAHCDKNIPNRRRIVVNPVRAYDGGKKVEEWSPELLAVTIYHELGHCLLNRQHDGKNARTIMTVSTENNFVPVIDKCFQYLVADLFERGQPTYEVNYLRLPFAVFYKGEWWLYGDAREAADGTLRKTCYYNPRDGI